MIAMRGGGRWWNVDVSSCTVRAAGVFVEPLKRSAKSE